MFNIFLGVRSMIAAKKYFLYSLIINSFCLTAMDSNDRAVIAYNYEIVRNKVDYNHLGIGKTTCFRPIIGSYLSYYKTILLPKEKVAAEMKRIQTYIPSNDHRKAVLLMAAREHWYVNYLMQALIIEKVKKIHSAKGTTIDKLCFPDFTSDINGMNEIIHKLAYAAFFENSSLKSFTDRLEFMCKRAFWNSEYESEELTALKKSRCMCELTNAIQDKFLTRIQSQLDKLT